MRIATSIPRMHADSRGLKRIVILSGSFCREEPALSERSESKGSMQFAVGVGAVDKLHGSFAAKNAAQDDNENLRESVEKNFSGRVP